MVQSLDNSNPAPDESPDNSLAGTTTERSTSYQELEQSIAYRKEQRELAGNLASTDSENKPQVSLKTNNGENTRPLESPVKNQNALIKLGVLPQSINLKSLNQTNSNQKLFIPDHQKDRLTANIAKESVNDLASRASEVLEINDKEQFGEKLQEFYSSLFDLPVDRNFQYYSRNEEDNKQNHNNFLEIKKEIVNEFFESLPKKMNELGFTQKEIEGIKVAKEELFNKLNVN